MRLALAALLLLAGCPSDDAPGDDGGPDADLRDDAGVRYPRLGLICACADGSSNFPCESDACGADATCKGGRCAVDCDDEADCLAISPDATCIEAEGSCVYGCSTSAECIDRDVNFCAPIGSCAEPRM